LFLRTFRTLSASTLQELGDYFGVSRERIRQVESACTKVIRRRLETARFRPLVEASARFTETIGLAIPISVAETAGLCGISGESIERASFMRCFLLWLSGSYEVTDEWVIKQPVNQSIWKTQRVTKSLLGRGPASSEELIGNVCALGFRKDVARQWVSKFGQVRVLGPMAIRWEGSLADKATAILEFQSEPMNKGRISELLGSDHSIRTLSNYLSADERFKRFGPDLFGLSKWGAKE
jgi:Sigma-70, region 4